MDATSGLKQTFSSDTAQFKVSGVDSRSDDSPRAIERAQKGNVGTGWMSRCAWASVEEATSNNLALQFAAQLLQDHPFWLTGVLSWTQLIRSLNSQMRAVESIADDGKNVAAGIESISGDAVFSTIHGLVKKVDGLLDDNFRNLAKTFSVDLVHIFSQVGMF